MCSCSAGAATSRKRHLARSTARFLRRASGIAYNGSMRSAAAVTTLVTVCCLAACSGKPTPAPAPSKPVPIPATAAAAETDLQPSAALQLAMTAFTQALRDANKQVILTMFSSTQSWNVINTRSPLHMPTVVSHARLAEALNQEGPLHDPLLGAHPNNLRAFVTGEHSAPWKARGPYQFAPEKAPQGQVWIAWRQEADRWVVDTVAWPVN